MELIPFIVFPIIAILIKWLMNSYFASRRKKYDHRIKDLSERKKKLLDEIKELEPYNVVQRILERHDPASLQQSRQPPPNNRGNNNRGGDLRQRRPPPGQMGPGGRGRHIPPTQNQRPPPPPPSSGPPPTSAPLPPSGPAPPGPRIPHYLPPRYRSVTEKLVDYLIGDGPNRRFALICSSCHSHNGMALQDEFEYTSFKCAYCFTLNKARKTLPTAPPIERQISDGEQTRREENKDNGTTPTTPGAVTPRAVIPGAVAQPSATENTRNEPDGPKPTTSEEQFPPANEVKSPSGTKEEPFTCN